MVPWFCIVIELCATQWLQKYSSCEFKTDKVELEVHNSLSARPVIDQSYKLKEQMDLSLIRACNLQDRKGWLLSREAGLRCVCLNGSDALANSRVPANSRFLFHSGNLPQSNPLSTRQQKCSNNQRVSYSPQKALTKIYFQNIIL